MTYEEQLQDPRWKEKAKSIKERDRYRCAECGLATADPHVHHLKYSWNTMAWDYSDDLLVTLCSVCHAKAHGKSALKTDNQEYPQKYSHLLSLPTIPLAVRALQDQINFLEFSLINLNHNIPEEYEKIEAALKEINFLKNQRKELLIKDNINIDQFYAQQNRA